MAEILALHEQYTIHTKLFYDEDKLKEMEKKYGDMPLDVDKDDHELIAKLFEEAGMRFVYEITFDDEEYDSEHPQYFDASKYLLRWLCEKEDKGFDFVLAEWAKKCVTEHDNLINK